MLDDYVSLTSLLTTLSLPQGSSNNILLIHSVEVQHASAIQQRKKTNYKHQSGGPYTCTSIKKSSKKDDPSSIDDRFKGRFEYSEKPLTLLLSPSVLLSLNPF